MKDLTGNVFGRLTVIKIVGCSRNKQGNLWLCECSCGNVVNVGTSKLIGGRVKSCGCLRRDLAKSSHQKHGLDCRNTRNRLYSIWLGIRERCEYEHNISYKSYGGRGIIVCEEWKSFKNFKNWALSNGYDTSKTIDRIDNNGNYEPKNCQWIDADFNRVKQRKTIFICCNGLVGSLTAWAKIIHVSPCTLKKKYIQEKSKGVELFVSSIIKEKNIDTKEWTQKGRLFLYDFLKQRNTLPKIEQ